jgi:hypothetical protein
MMSHTLRVCTFVVAGVLLAAADAAWGQPSNDNCANAIVVVGGSSISFNSTQATNDGPLHACEAGGAGFGHTIWYRYAAPVSGSVTVDTCGCSFDSVLSVWTGACGGLSLLACADDSCTGLSSTVTFIAVAGTTYLIQVGSYGTGAGGSGTLTVADLTSGGPSAFTFQGVVASAGTPINGTADVRFQMFDQPIGGFQVGSTLDLTGVTLQSGLLTCLLDFGEFAFPGSDRWVELSVRAPAGTGPYVTLAPRQELHRTPYARRADSATSAVNVSWAGITSKPSGFADGIDNEGPWDLNGTSAFYTGGSVGIGTNTPASDLHVFRGDSGVTTPRGNSVMVAENAANCYLSLPTPAANESGVFFGSPTNSSDGSIVYNNGGARGLHLRTAGNITRVEIDSLGNVGVGTASNSIDARLHVQASGARCIKVDRYSSDGELLAWARDDGVVGSVTVAGGVVTYGAFTGVHYSRLEQPAEVGALVSMTGRNGALGNRDPSEAIYGVVPCTRANDPAVLGAYIGMLDGKEMGHPEDIAQVAAVGNGDMWIIDTGSPIRPGDELISSDVPGCAMKDDPAKFATGHIIARAAACVEWNTVVPDASGVRRARVSVLFTAFTRAASPAAESLAAFGVENQDLRSRVSSLERDNADLRARLGRLEQMISARAGSRP